MWTEAKSYCDSFALAGQGWRLPTKIELESICRVARLVVAPLERERECTIAVRQDAQQVLGRSQRDARDQRPHADILAVQVTVCN